MTFSADLAGASGSPDLTWAVEEATGGTIDDRGRYTAPDIDDGTFHVIASHANDPTRSGRATVHVRRTKLSVSITPESASIRPGSTMHFDAAVKGAYPSQSTAVTWSVSESGGGSVDGSGNYTAPSVQGTYHVVATSVADPSRNAQAVVQVNAAAAGNVSVSVTPGSASVPLGSSSIFKATVTGATPGQSTAVIWSVRERDGGSIDGSGRYSAPAAPGTFHVVATSVADLTRSAEATVTVSGTAPGISVAVKPATVSTTTGAKVTFAATVSGTSRGQSNAVTWSVQEGGGGTIDGSGRYTAPTSAGTFHVVATSVADPSRWGVATVTVSTPAPPAPDISVAISPESASTTVKGTVAFAASVTGAARGQSSAVTWSVRERGGGSVSSAGTYTAPATAGTFHVVATSVANPSKSAQATVTVSTAPTPPGVSVSVSPGSASTSTHSVVAFSASVTGVAQGQSTAVTWSVRESGGGTVDASGHYTAPAQAGTFHVVATSVADASKSAQATITVSTPAPTISVSVAPSSASTTVNGALSFSATVTGTAPGQSTAVIWSIREGGGGTIDASGHYTAPGSAGTFHVIATSVADSSKSAQATVTVSAPAPSISVAVAPSSASTTVNGALSFSATVTGTSPGQSNAVTWSVREGGGGTVDASGHYTAPSSAGTFHVVATSVADGSKSAQATVTVSAPAPSISVAVSPGSASTLVGGGLSFSATVTGTSPGQSTAVTWSVREGGGGTVDASGHYTAPSSAGTFHVVATSVADASKSAQATISVSTPAPTISVAVAPSSASTTVNGALSFSATVTGTWPGQSTAVTWSVLESGGGSVNGSGRYTAPASAGTFHVVATSVADASKSAQATVTVSAPAPSISVAVAPSSASTTVGGALSFSATVTGTSPGQSTAVTWSVLESGGGTVDASGQYTAPGGAGTFHVVATSLADASKSAQATVTVSSGGGGSILPPDRTTVWNPGLNPVGGIPSASWAICATVSPSGGDDASAIQRALDSCPPNQVVKLSAGTFSLSRAVSIRSSVALRGSGGPGAGASQTKLVAKNGKQLVLFDPGQNGFTQITDLAADAAKDAYTLTLATPRALSVGELVMIDQLTDSLTDWGDQDGGAGAASRGWFERGPGSQGEAVGRPIGQMMEVASVSGATVTFTTPFHITFRTSNKAQLLRLSNDSSGNGPVVAALRYAGVEDLMLSGGVGGDNGANVSMNYCAYCWIRNIEAEKSDGSSVAMTGTFRSVLRDSYLHDTVDPNPGGAGYGVSLNWHAADNLVENNISWNFNKVMVMRASGGGNVIGYNYMEDGWISYAPCWVEVGLNASHMTTPMYELFEGNESFNFDGDSTWGNAIYITVFRNHLTGLRRAIPPLNAYSTTQGGNRLVYEDTQNRRAIGLMSGHRYYTFLGNVLGTQGQTPVIVRSQGIGQPGPLVYGTGVNPAPWTSDVTPMWQLGYNPTTWSPQEDQSVISTVIRDGNFDYVTNSVRWDRGAQPLPSSLYLSGKPAFFGSNPWPWVDPIGSTKVAVLPARQRFDSLHP